MAAAFMVIPMLFARPPFYQTALKSLFNGLLGSKTHRDEGPTVGSRRWAETVKLWQWATVFLCQTERRSKGGAAGGTKQKERRPREGIR